MSTLPTAPVRRLPGVAFDPAVAPPRRALPRMDIAAFVGFAASGPVDVPVAVTDAARFAEIFGADAPLAVDPERGTRLTAQLAPAVRAFFRGGGQRAWIVRVAGRSTSSPPEGIPAPVTSRFPVPGLVCAVAGEPVEQAHLSARAGGSWADGLTVSAAVTSTPATVVAVGSAGELELRHGPDVVRPGELLRLHTGQHVRYVVVDAVSGGAGSTSILTCEPDGDLWLSPAGVAAGTAGTARYRDAAGAEVVVPAVVLGPAAISCRGSIPPAAGGLVRVERLPTGLAGSVWLMPTSTTVDANGHLVLHGTVQLAERRPPLTPVAVGDAVERLRLELHVRAGDATVRVLRDLGLAPQHPRYLGALPNDEQLFGLRETAGPDPALWAEVDAPRFPLAAPSGAGVHYPIGVGPVLGPGAGRIADPTDALVRDGLEDYAAELFVDRHLGNVGADALGAAADAVRWFGPAPRPLCGIHAVLGIDEVTLLAVPDAVHRGWHVPPWLPPPSPPPSPDPPSVPEGDGFVDCAPAVPPPPPLLWPPVSGTTGTLTVGWTGIGRAAIYRLEESNADQPGWTGARTVYLGPATSTVRFTRTDGVWFYRVRAEADGVAGAWSAGVHADLRRTTGAVLDPVPGFRPDTVLSVHGAALRLCAARRDVLAVLGPPEHYRVPDVVAHARAVRAADPDAAAFGALYHPWMVVAPPDRPREIRRVGPDGPVAAVLARRARARGAWVAPANEALTDIIALVGPEPDPRMLFQEQVNLVRQERDRFRCLAQDTLAADAAVRPVNVRRLVALLRRLVLREGADYAFEPNDTVLRRAVERGFTEVLAGMYRLGAFAGATASEAFRVDVDDPPNTAASVDAGRLVVELRFAPSHPLEFVLVRFARVGDGSGPTLESP